MTTTTHVTLDSAGTLHTLVLQQPGTDDVTLTVRGPAPERLRYQGQLWTATHMNPLGSPTSRDHGYRIILDQ